MIRNFPIEDILSITTGKLIGSVQGLRELQEYIKQQDSEASDKEVKAFLQAQLPGTKNIHFNIPQNLNDSERSRYVVNFIKEVRDTYGPYHPVEQLMDIGFVNKVSKQDKGGHFSR